MANLYVIITKKAREECLAVVVVWLGIDFSWQVFFFQLLLKDI
jgi:hypothetical protein